MTSFAYPWLLILLVIVPVLAIWQFAPRFRRLHQGTFIFSATNILQQQTPSIKTYITYAADVLVLVALTLFIIALARPQTVNYLELDADGIDIFVAFDMSGSMRAIDDTIDEVQMKERRGQPVINRFDGALETLKTFVGERENDRIGTVLFAKEAFLQFPLTLNYNAILTALNEMHLGDIDEDGTAIGNALARAVAGLQHSDATTRIVILITDGDRRGGNISPKQAAEMARDLGIIVYPILVGRDGPVLVPAGQDLFSGRVTYRAVEFPIAPHLLQEIADITNGRYFRAEDGLSMIDDLNAILDEHEQSRLDDNLSVYKDELFVPFVLIAIVLLILQFLVRHTFCRSFN